MSKFSYDTFTNLIKTKGLKYAEKYRDSMRDKGVNKAVETMESEINETGKDEIEVTKEDLQAKLKEAQITYFKGAKTEKLLELCIENNLL